MGVGWLGEEPRSKLTSSTGSSLELDLFLLGEPSSLMSLKLERRPSDPLVWPLAFL